MYRSSANSDGRVGHRPKPLAHAHVNPLDAWNGASHKHSLSAPKLKTRAMCAHGGFQEPGDPMGVPTAKSTTGSISLSARMWLVVGLRKCEK